MPYQRSQEPFQGTPALCPGTNGAFLGGGFSPPKLGFKWTQLLTIRLNVDHVRELGTREGKQSQLSVAADGAKESHWAPAGPSQVVRELRG